MAFGILVLFIILLIACSIRSERNIQREDNDAEDYL